MRVLIIDVYYPTFLKETYRRIPELDDEAYHRQWRHLMDQCFGTADFYSTNLQLLGHEATEIVANCQPLQMRWGQEHDLRPRRTVAWRRIHGVPVPKVVRDWSFHVSLAQIREFRPDVVHVQDPVGTPASFLAAIRPLTRVISTQIASPISPGVPFHLYDLVLSAFPHFVERFQRANIRSRYFRLGFETTILDRLENRPKTGAVFVGGMSPAHAERIDFFSRLAQRVPFEWWGYGAQNVPVGSRLREFYRGEAWGLDMYNRLHAAKISINHHIDVAENNANNMRLYEATGVGSLLLTDDKANLPDLFAPGSEIVSYRSVAECAESIEYYLEHEPERARIAAAGQQRTVREHSYYQRMHEFTDIVASFL